MLTIEARLGPCCRVGGWMIQDPVVLFDSLAAGPLPQGQLRVREELSQLQRRPAGTSRVGGCVQMFRRRAPMPSASLTTVAYRKAV